MCVCVRAHARECVPQCTLGVKCQLWPLLSTLFEEVSCSLSQHPAERLIRSFQEFSRVFLPSCHGMIADMPYLAWLLCRFQEFKPTWAAGSSPTEPSSQPGLLVLKGLHVKITTQVSLCLPLGLRRTEEQPFWKDGFPHLCIGRAGLGMWFLSGFLQCHPHPQNGSR